MPRATRTRLERQNLAGSDNTISSLTIDPPKSATSAFSFRLPDESPNRAPYDFSEFVGLPDLDRITAEIRRLLEGRAKTSRLNTVNQIQKFLRWLLERVRQEQGFGIDEATIKQYRDHVQHAVGDQQANTRSDSFGHIRSFISHLQIAEVLPVFDLPISLPREERTPTPNFADIALLTEEALDSECRALRDDLVNQAGMDRDEAKALALI